MLESGTSWLGGDRLLLDFVNYQVWSVYYCSRYRRGVVMREKSVSNIAPRAQHSTD